MYILQSNPHQTCSLCPMLGDCMCRGEWVCESVTDEVTELVQTIAEHLPSQMAQRMDCTNLRTVLYSLKALGYISSREFEQICRAIHPEKTESRAPRKAHLLPFIAVAFVPDFLAAVSNVVGTLLS